MNIGNRIKELRIKSGFSQNYLAGISQTHLRRVELGQADITCGHLQLVCDALGITLRDFFSIQDESDEITAVTARLSVKQKKLLIDFLKSL